MFFYEAKVVCPLCSHEFWAALAIPTQHGSDQIFMVICPANDGVHQSLHCSQKSPHCLTRPQLAHFRRCRFSNRHLRPTCFQAHARVGRCFGGCGLRERRNNFPLFKSRAARSRMLGDQFTVGQGVSRDGSRVAGMHRPETDAGVLAGQGQSAKIAAVRLCVGVRTSVEDVR